MGSRAELLLVVLGVIGAALLVALLCLGFAARQRRRRSVWNRRFTDARFTPRQEDVNKAYAKYDAPTYLRTPTEERELLPSILRRQAR